MECPRYRAHLPGARAGQPSRGGCISLGGCMRRTTPLLLVLVFAVTLAAACSKAPSDEAIAAAVQARMFTDPQVKSVPVGVTVKQGEVILTGEVPSDAVRYQAYKLAADTPGVKKVQDQMSVHFAEVSPPIEEPPAPAPTRKSVRKTPALPRQESAHSFSGPPASSAQPSTPPPPAEPPKPQPVQAEISAGTSVTIRMIDSIDS